MNSESPIPHKPSLSYDKENRMATFAEDATVNTYTYDSDRFKKVENVGGSRPDASGSATPEAITTNLVQAERRTSTLKLLTCPGHSTQWSLR